MKSFFEENEEIFLKVIRENNIFGRITPKNDEGKLLFFT